MTLQGSVEYNQTMIASPEELAVDC